MTKIGPFDDAMQCLPNPWIKMPMVGTTWQLQSGWVGKRKEAKRTPRPLAHPEAQCPEKRPPRHASPLSRNHGMDDSAAPRCIAVAAARSNSTGERTRNRPLELEEEAAPA